MKIIGSDLRRNTMGELLYCGLDTHEEYSWWAKDSDGCWHNGYIVVEDGWYASSNEWTYYLYVSTHFGLDRIEVDKTTILPNTLRNRIKIFLEQGYCVGLSYTKEHFLVTEIDLKICPDANEDEYIEEITQHIAQMPENKGE